MERSWYQSTAVVARQCQTPVWRFVMGRRRRTHWCAYTRLRPIAAHLSHSATYAGPVGVSRQNVRTSYTYSAIREHTRITSVIAGLLPPPWPGSCPNKLRGVRELFIILDLQTPIFARFKTDNADQVAGHVHTGQVLHLLC